MQTTDTSKPPNLWSDNIGVLDEHSHEDVSSVVPLTTEDVLIKVPGAVINLVDGDSTLELARDDLYIISLSQGDGLRTVFVRIGDEVQWLLTKDATTFKLRDSLYLFKLLSPRGSEDEPSSSDEEDSKDNKTVNSDGDNDSEDTLLYSLTVEWKDEENQMKEFDGILQTYSNFLVYETQEQVIMEEEENVESGSGLEILPAEMNTEKKKEIGQCLAYFRRVEPDVGRYTSRPAKLVAKGSAELIKGILKSGDSTMELLNWVDEVMKKKMNPNSKSQISPVTLRRIRRVKRMTRTTEVVVTGVLSGVVNATSKLNRAILNTAVAKKFLNFSTGQFVYASFEGMSKVCDAAEEVGKNVLSKSSNVTTSLVNQRYGEQAAEATREGLGAAGHVLGTAFSAFSIRKAFDPSNVIKSGNSDAKSATDKKSKFFKLK